MIGEITVEQPDPQAEPIRYVGGPPNTSRPPAWPYALIAGALVVILVGGVLLCIVPEWVWGRYRRQQTTTRD